MLIAEVATALAALALAGFVAWAAPRRAAKACLLTFLLIASVNAGVSALAGWTTNAWLAYHAHLYARASIPLLYGSYVLFTAMAVDTPLARPLRSRVGALVWIAVHVALATSFFVAPSLAISAFTRTSAGTYETEAGAASALYSVAAIFATLWALAAAWDAWRRAPPGSAARQRAKAFAAAFAILNAAILGGITLIPDLDLANLLIYLGALASWSLLVRAMVRERLLDVDLRIQLGVKRTTLVAIFLGAFFVAAEVAQNFLAGEYGYLVGGVAAGLLLFAIAPLQKVAERVSEAAMPRVRDSPEYRDERRREVYRAAVETAMEDGGISEKERTFLATLAQHLGLGAKDALDIERDVATTRAA